MKTGPYFVAGGRCSVRIQGKDINGNILSAGRQVLVRLDTGEAVEVPWQELRGERR